MELTTRQVEEGVLEAILALAKDDPLCEALSGASASPRAWDGSSMTPVQVVIGAARAFRDHLASMDVDTRREAFRATALVVFSLVEDPLRVARFEVTGLDENGKERTEEVVVDGPPRPTPEEEVVMSARVVAANHRRGVIIPDSVADLARAVDALDATIPDDPPSFSRAD